MILPQYNAKIISNIQHRNHLEIYRKPTLIQLFFAAPNYFFLLFPYPAETIHPEIHTAFLFFAKSSEIIKELHTLPLRIDEKMSLINLHTFFRFFPIFFQSIQRI